MCCSYAEPGAARGDNVKMHSVSEVAQSPMDGGDSVSPSHQSPAKCRARHLPQADGVSLDYLLTSCSKCALVNQTWLTFSLPLGSFAFSSAQWMRRVGSASI